MNNNPGLYPPKYIGFDEHPFPDGMFGITRCPNDNCNMYWTMHFVPEHCPECHAKVTNTPGTAFANNVELCRQKKIPISISTCTVCGFEIPCEPEPWNNTCPKCWGELKLTQLNGKPVSDRGSSILKGVFHRIKKSF